MPASAHNVPVMTRHPRTVFSMPQRTRLLAGLCLPVILLVACSSQPSSDAKPVPGPAAAPAPPAVPPPYYVYVTNEGSGDLSVIDPIARAVATTIPLGKRPRGVKANADGTQLFAALSGSPVAGPGVDESKLPPADKAADGIGIVDTVGRKLLKVVNGGSDPEQLAVTAHGARAYIANEDAEAASVLELASGKIVASVPVGSEPEGVTMRPDGREVYV